MNKTVSHIYFKLNIILKVWYKYFIRIISLNSSKYI